MVPSLPRARWRRLRRALCVELGLLTLLIAPVAYLFAAPDNPTGLRLVLVGGPSMQPLLGTMNVLLMRQTDRLARLDVAQVRRDGIHRIVGLPGETVWVRGGHICVASSPAPTTPPRCPAEPYVGITNPTWNTAPRRLGRDEFAWAADNRVLRFLVVRRRCQFDAVLLWAVYSWGGHWH